MAGVDGAGATAVVAILDGRQATLANIGDSGAAEVYADKNDGRLVGQMLTVAHKPHVEAEQRRIVSAGGAVQQVRGAWRVVPRALSGSNRSLCKTVATVTEVPDMCRCEGRGGWCRGSCRCHARSATPESNPWYVAKPKPPVPAAADCSTALLPYYGSAREQ